MIDLKIDVSREFNCDAKTLFEAIAEGALFRHTQNIPEKSSMDFRPQGQYQLEWEDCGGAVVKGVFKEISKYDKVVFSWDAVSGKYTSLVTITLDEASKGKTLLKLVHEGFETEELVKDHSMGWNGALDSFVADYRSVEKAATP